MPPVVAFISAAITAGGTAFAAGTVGSFLTTTVVGRLLTTVALTALSRAMAPKPRATASGIRSERTLTGGTTPASFILGRYATEGQLVAPPMSHGQVGGTPNAYLTYVIELGDTPGQTLESVILNGEPVTLGATPHADYGLPVEGKFTGFAWIKYYDGTQTAADPMLIDKYGADPDRPWTADMIGTGICYAICTFRLNRQLFSSFPPVRFVMGGIPLYDPRKDTSVGGTGAHRWADPSTWEASENPAVQWYNILRGITLPGGDNWGGQADAADLPLADWFAAMNAADAPVALSAGGTEPAWRAGYEVFVNDEPASVMEEIGKACSGQIAEVGGVWKPQIGPARLPVIFLTDDDLNRDEAKTFDPFPAPSDIYNGVQASHPAPDALWQSTDAPPLYNTTYEAEDGGQRHVADLSLPAAPYPVQVQRLMRAYLEDNRRLRRHGLTLPPEAIALEPLDTVSWTSAANGYSAKAFEIAAQADPLVRSTPKATMRERDGSDYDWVPGDETPVSFPPTRTATPAAYAIASWTLAPATIADASGADRRPALAVTWDTAGMDDISGVAYELRVQATGAAGPGGTFGDVAAGTGTIGAGILPATAYEVRLRPIPTSGRAAAWTAWKAATTGDVRITTSDVDPGAITWSELGQDVHDQISAAGNADVSATNAANAASDAAASATAAASDAAQAATSKTAAETAKTIAETAQGLAEAAQAAAKTAQTAAETAEGITVTAAKSVLPDSFEQTDTYWTDNWADPVNSTDGIPHADAWPVDGGQTCVEFNADASLIRRVLTAGAATALAGEVWRVRAKVKQVAGTAGRTTLRVRVAALDAALAIVTGQDARQSAALAALNTWEEIEATLTLSDPLSSQVWVRAGVESLAGDAADLFRVQWIKLTNVTESTNAAASATAAATSASSAAASNTAAGQSASAAQTAQVAAETAQSAAQVSETNAATSETNAAGSASAAATSATQAATSETNAGDSASAAAGSATTSSTKASEAATSASNAATSEQNAAASAAGAASDAAATAADVVTTASNATATSADAAATAQDVISARAARDAASSSATAAAGSASNAAASETAAGQSASAASAAATNAATSESNAATSASQAATSETSAAGSAASAASQATVAASTAAQVADTAATLGPPTPDLPATSWTWKSSGADASLRKPAIDAADIVTDPDFGTAYAFPTATNRTLGQASPFDWDDTRVYAVQALFRAVDDGTVVPDAGGGPGAQCRLGASVQAGTTMLQANRQEAGFVARVADGVQSREVWFTRRAASAMPATVPASVAQVVMFTAAADGGNRFYPHLRQNWSGSVTTDGRLHVGALRVRDITAHVDALIEAEAAAASASAAATSEANASASETTAGQSASAAQLSAANAATSEGSAATSATQAATSETNAAGSASSAATSATTAAGSATDAGNSANAASGSASTAATKATDAQQSASAAATSATSASTSAAGAAISETNAATAATNASDAAAGAIAARDVAARLYKGNAYQNPVFTSWGGTWPDGMTVVPGSEGGTVTKSATGKYGPCVEINTNGVPTTNRPYIEVRGNNATWCLLPKPAKVEGVHVEIELEKISGSWAGTVVRVQWVAGSGGTSANVDYLVLDHLSGGDNTVVQTFQADALRPASFVAGSTDGYVRVRLFGTSTAAGGVLSNVRFRVHSLSLQQLSTSASAYLHQMAIGDLQGKAAASLVLRAKAGGATGAVEVVAADDPVTGPASKVRMGAAEIELAGDVLVGGAITSANYAEDAGGVPTAGYRFDHANGTLKALNIVSRSAVQDGAVSKGGLLTAFSVTPGTKTNGQGMGSLVLGPWALGEFWQVAARLRYRHYGQSFVSSTQNKDMTWTHSYLQHRLRPKLQWSTRSGGSWGSWTTLETFPDSPYDGSWTLHETVIPMQGIYENVKLRMLISTVDVMVTDIDANQGFTQTDVWECHYVARALVR